MSCEWVSKNCSLFLYGELSLEQEQDFQDHLEACAACKQEFERCRAIHQALDEREMLPAGALLARCRRDLELRLDLVQAGESAWKRWLGLLFGGEFRLARPAGALALVALGFFGARLTMAPAGGPLRLASSQEPSNVISRIRYLQPEPSGKVRLVVEETRQRQLTGDPSDDSIRRLLLAAARESSDPGLRAGSMDLLSSRSGSGQLRPTLLFALQHDPNAGVRLKALEALKPYAGDAQVRSALAKVLLSDDNPGVRTQAIDLLVQHKEDSLVGVLQELVQRESNSYVRLRCQKALEDMNASVGTF